MVAIKAKDGEIPPVFGEVEKTDEEGEFDIDGALKTKGFTDFLAKFKDVESFDVNNPDAVHDRFLVFKEKENIKIELRTLFTKQIRDEMGINLDDSQLKLIDDDIEKKAVENPGNISDLRSELDSFRGMPAQIKTLEKELTDLGQKSEYEKTVGDLEIKQKNLEEAKDYLGLMGGIALRVEVLDYYAKAIPNALTKTFDIVSNLFSKDKPYGSSDDTSLSLEKQKIDDRFAALEFVRNRSGKIDKNKAQTLIDHTLFDIDTAKERIKKIEDTETKIKQTRESFARLRKDLFGKITSIGNMKEVIQAKVKKQFEELTNKFDNKPVMSDLERAKEMFADLRERFETSETGIDPLDSIDQNRFVKVIDGDMEVAVSEMIENELANGKGFGELESALVLILGKKEIGYKKDDEVKEVVVRILENVRKSLTGDGSVVKKILLARIIGKVKDNKYQKQ